MGIGGILHLHANVTTSKSQVTLNWKIGASGGYNTDAHGLTYDETLVVNGCDAVFNAPSTIGSACEVEFDAYATEPGASAPEDHTDSNGDAAIPVYDPSHCGLPGPPYCSGSLTVSADGLLGPVTLVDVYGVGFFIGPPAQVIVIPAVPEGTYTVTVWTAGSGTVPGRSSEVQSVAISCTQPNYILLKYSL